MEPVEQLSLIKKLTKYAKATHPINPKMLRKIPHLTTIFPDEALCSLLVRLSGDDGIAHFEHKNYQAGETIIAKGKFDQMIYWVLSGQADIVTTIKNQPKIIHKSHPGECIGALGVLRGAVRTADVVAGKEGVSVIELDWAITDKEPDLGKLFYHLVALNLADELSHAYNMQLQIISNSIDILQKKTSQLIQNNRSLERLLNENNIPVEDKLGKDQAQTLNMAIANIRESLSLLEMQAKRDNLDTFGI